MADALICMGQGDAGTQAKAALAEVLEETGIAAREAAALAAFDRHIKNPGRQKGAPKKKRRPVAKRRK
jgi:hypothetical protein